MTPAPSVTAVLPAFNEAAVIAGVVVRTADALREGGAVDYEIVIVDDGSSDGTAVAARDAATDQSRVRVLQHSINRGYGAALRSGFEAARREAVWLLDSDGQFDPADLERLLPLYAPDTVVLGYRLQRRDTWIRRANHAAFFSLVRWLFGPTVRDVNCAFKLFPREVGISLRSEGAVISTELILRAQRSGFRIIEVGIPHYPRLAGKATGARVSVVLKAFRELWRLRRDPGALSALPAPSPTAGDA